MSRLAARAKMGYFPTPGTTAVYIRKMLRFSDQAVCIDPCCGDGEAMFRITPIAVSRYGIEADAERAVKGGPFFSKIACASIYDMVIKPAECFSFLYLNPPYDWEDKERTEFKFLKHAHRWLKAGGVLVYVVPERIFGIERIKQWIARNYRDIRVVRVAEEDWPRFKQAVLFGVKKEEESESEFPEPQYPFIDTVAFTYDVPEGIHPEVFEGKTINPEEIKAYRDQEIKNIKDALFGVEDEETKIMRPLFPLRKGHMLSVLLAGVLNGAVKIGEKEVIFKCFTTRKEFPKVSEDGKHKIITDTYVSGIRIMERGKWYDVR